MSNLVRESGSTPATVAEERSVTVGPRVDVLETEHEFLVLADLPGVKPGDVDLRYEKGELSVHGRRTLAARGESLSYHRAFSLADTIAADKITAELKSGVLTIRLPKVEAAKPKRISVTA